MIIRSCQKVPQSPFEVGNGEAPVERLFEGPGEGIEATQGFGRVARAAEIGVDAVSEDRRATPSQTPAYLGPLRTRARKPFSRSGRFPARSAKSGRLSYAGWNSGARLMTPRIISTLAAFLSRRLKDSDEAIVK